jgi:hypothetical protein
MGNDPYKRKPEEVMTGFLGAGGWSDGKLNLPHSNWRTYVKILW